MVVFLFKKYTISYLANQSSGLLYETGWKLKCKVDFNLGDLVLVIISQIKFRELWVKLQRPGKVGWEKEMEFYLQISWGKRWQERREVHKEKCNKILHYHNTPHAKCKFPLHLWLNSSFVDSNVLTCKHIPSTVREIIKETYFFLQKFP